MMLAPAYLLVICSAPPKHKAFTKCIWLSLLHFVVISLVPDRDYTPLQCSVVMFEMYVLQIMPLVAASWSMFRIEQTK